VQGGGGGRDLGWLLRKRVDLENVEQERVGLENVEQKRVYFENVNRRGRP
jgi:hypothetical protein